MNSQPTFLILTSFFNLKKWPYYGKYVNQITHNSQKVSFTNIWGLCLIFLGCESFLESNSPDILALCETNLNYSSDSGNFSVKVCPPLIHGLESLADSYLCLQLALLHSVSYSFFSVDHVPCLCVQILVLFHLT